MDDQNLTVEQRTQAVIDFNKWLDALPAILPSLTQEQKEQLAAEIEARKRELGLLDDQPVQSGSGNHPDQPGSTTTETPRETPTATDDTNTPATEVPQEPSSE